MLAFNQVTPTLLFRLPRCYFSTNMTDSAETSRVTQPIALACVWRATPRGPSAVDMFHALIADAGRPLLCIQCLWVRGSSGWGLEFTAFFQGNGRFSAVLLGGVLGDGERRVLHGGLPDFLEIPAARAIGEEIARQWGAEFYFPGDGMPDDRWGSWLDV